MELHIIDRISIPSILPSENSFMDYNLKRSIIKKVGITKGDVENTTSRKMRKTNALLGTLTQTAKTLWLWISLHKSWNI